MNRMKVGVLGATGMVGQSYLRLLHNHPWFEGVYYSHMCVHPDYQGRGIGRGIVERLKKRYTDFHQHAVLSDGKAVGFYEKLGFSKPGTCQALWIYNGHDHDI